MFCQKCGNKIEENAVFCSRCGAKQPIVDVVEQSIDNAAISLGAKDDVTVMPIETATKAYELLKENAALCPEIKSFLLKEDRSTAVVVGKINQYSIRISNGQIGLNSFPVFPFVIPMCLCILGVILLMVTMYMRGFNEEFMLIVVLFTLLSGLSGIGVSVFGNKEKKIVWPFIKKVLGQPKYIEQFQHIEIFTYSLFVFGGIGYMIIFGLLQ